MNNLTIEYIPIDQLKPYEKNARKHEQLDIDNIAMSIEKYGFNDPVGIATDKNIIVEGHGRVMACRKLGIDVVPCVRLDHLTTKQRREYAIAHNATAELSKWDRDILPQELEDLDLDDFDFDFSAFEVIEQDDLPQEEKSNEALRTDDAFNYWDFDAERTEGEWQMPTLYPCYKIPKRMIGFNYALTSTDYDACIHFYLDDYQFERVWNQPEKYIEILKRFDIVLTPSYSLYMDVAEPIKMYNVFRSRLLGQMLQDAGVKVIPIVYWADEKSFEYCFDGLPERSVVSTLTMGTNKEEIWKHWKKGMDELIRRKNPKTILLYGNGLKVDYDFGDIEVIYYQNEVTERLKNWNNES